MSVHEAVTKTRFTKCGASVRVGNQIIYVCNSQSAMTGSRTAKDGDKDKDKDKDQMGSAVFSFTTAKPQLGYFNVS